MAWILLLVAVIALVFLHRARVADAQKAKHAATEAERAFREQLEELTKELAGLRPFRDVKDAIAEAQAHRTQGRDALAAALLEATAIRSAAQTEANQVRAQAIAAAEVLKRDAKTSQADAQAKIALLTSDAVRRAAKIVADAEARAAEIAGDAYRALKEADQLKHVTSAMQNVIEGYGDRYLVPTYSLLDQLGEAYPAQRERSPAAHTAPPTPGNVRASQGPSSGQIIARCERIPGGVLYQWRYATAQAPTTYTVTDTGSKATVTLENMVPGTQYLIQVRACGRRGSSDWSNALTKYAV